jgi:thiol peroxidase
MSSITLGGNTIHTNGELPAKGNSAPDFKLLNNNLEEVDLSNYKGQRIVMNVFPSIDTDVCATSVKNFDKRAKELENTTVLNISRDTPFAQKRFKNDNDIDNVELLSDFRNGKFGEDYGLLITDGAFNGLHSRAVIVLNENGEVIYNQQVQEIGEEPDYLAALKSLL